MRPRIIIPAAGLATRFNGLPKELLPIDPMNCSLTRAVRLGQQLGDVVIVTNWVKQALHEFALHLAELEAEFIPQSPALPELWGAIQCGLKRDVPGGLVLADTVTSIAALPEDRPKIMFGTFQTKTPERFSVVEKYADRIAIHTKEVLAHGYHAHGPNIWNAWGVILWDAEVTNFLMDVAETVDHYDRAFELAANVYSAGTFPLNYYYDLGTFPAYLEFLSTVHPIK